MIKTFVLFVARYFLIPKYLLLLSNLVMNWIFFFITWTTSSDIYKPIYKLWFERNTPHINKYNLPASLHDSNFRAETNSDVWESADGTE